MNLLKGNNISSKLIGSAFVYVDTTFVTIIPSCIRVVYKINILMSLVVAMSLVIYVISRILGGNGRHINTYWGGVEHARVK